jgi:hypothetical protein
LTYNIERREYMLTSLERWRGNSRANSAFAFSHFAVSLILIPSTGRICCSLWRNADNSPISHHLGHGQCHASIQLHLVHRIASLVERLVQVRSVVARELWRGSHGRSSNLRGSAPSPPCSLVVVAAGVNLLIHNAHRQKRKQPCDQRSGGSSKP